MYSYIKGLNVFYIFISVHIKLRFIFEIVFIDSPVISDNDSCFISMFFIIISFNLIFSSYEYLDVVALISGSISNLIAFHFFIYFLLLTFCDISY